MTKLTINIGTADKGDGDPLRIAFGKVNDNFTELYSSLGADGQLPPQTGNANKYLKTDGTVLSWSTVPAAQVQSDWNAVSGLGVILNKPTIPAAQVQSNWNAVSGLGVILNKPTIPTSFSSLVNGAHTASLGSDGGLTLPSTSGFIDRLYTDNGGSRTKLEKKIESSPTAGTIAKLELDLDNGHIRLAIGNYTGGNDQWIDTSTWAFRGDTGSLTLPPAGKIINNNNEWTFGTTGTLTTPGQVNAKTRIKIETTDVDTRYAAYLDTIEILTYTLAASGYTGAGLPARKESYEILVRAKASNPLIPDAAITQANNLRNLYYAWANATAELEVGDGFVIRDGDATYWRFEQLTGLRFPNNTFQTTAWTGITGFGEGFSLTDADKIVTNKLYSTNLTQPTQHYRLELDTNGVVRLPDGSIINGSTIRGVAGTSELNYTGITIGPNSNDAEKTWMWVDHANAYISTNNAANTWTFGTDGALTVPGVITRPVDDTLTLVTSGSNNNSSSISIDGEFGRTLLRTNDGTTLHTWEFDIEGILNGPGGVLSLPTNGKIASGVGAQIGYQAVFATDTLTGNTTTGDLSGLTHISVGSNAQLLALIDPDSQFSNLLYNLLSPITITYSDNTTQTFNEVRCTNIVTGTVMGFGYNDTTVGHSFPITLETANYAPAYSAPEWTFGTDGSLAYPNYALQRDTDTVECLGNASTVVYTASSDIQYTIKLLIQVEGFEGAAAATDSQACEMIVTKSFRANDIASSVYAVVHTSAAPLATFTAEWNALTSRIQVLCATPSANAVNVRIFATEIQYAP